ncbi:hypothetical protein HIM_09454 [Hirsutella minnesotensis 3608]|uniref:Serine hydrolase domain-containing protein n=1 Tax=Hirsutella minnesotensis 3608 TaxID=1043627 RepID=A0A0F7ZLI6_9HYPO|nr:hypothetical protein HIM_09454 [Hirsutella minnesotensis 3608]
MVASLLEDNRRAEFSLLDSDKYPIAFDDLEYPPLKFAVIISGYASSGESCRAFFDSPIKTPSMHMLGILDDVVDEETSLKLAARCQGPDDDKPNESIVVYHPGGHVAPSGKRELAAMTQFLKRCIG